MGPPHFTGKDMCEICRDIDLQIARYRRLKQLINDRQMEDAAVKLVAELNARKAALHPPEESRASGRR